MSKFSLQLILFFQLLWGGCAGTSQPQPSVKSAGSGIVIDGLPRSDTSRKGIELIAWRVADTRAVNEAIESNTRAGLKTNDDQLYRDSHIRVLRMEESDLARILETTSLIGGSKNTWCGQILEWRNIVEARTGRSLIDIMGDIMLVENGTLSISSRIWVEHSLDGADTRVEIVPHYESDTRSPISVLRSSRKRNYVFTELAVETVIPTNEILMITCKLSEFPDSPSKVDVDPEEPEKPESSMKSIEDAIDQSRSQDTEPAISDSPEFIAASVSLGESFFIRPSGIPDSPPERLIMLVVPRIPEAMLPQIKEQGTSGNP